MIFLDPDPALRLLGQLLAGTGHHFGVVIVGGAALRLRGDITRATVDVDVIAMVDPGDRSRLTPPEPEFPAPIRRAVAVVAEELGLPGDWFNAEVGAQWRTGLPPGFAAGLSWQQYGGLLVGIAGRQELIAFKLSAAADGTPTGKHFQDLLVLAASDAELEFAAQWVRTQDVSEEFDLTLTKVLHSVRHQRR